MSSRQSVEYLLVAEFDIDKGPTISHQYPDPLASDVKQLAELMLPDQMHVRTEDWTIFFLHFTPAASRRRTLSNGSDVNNSSRDPPLMYVLNLVNTKHDKEAKRYVFHESYHSLICVLSIDLALICFCTEAHKSKPWPSSHDTPFYTSTSRFCCLHWTSTGDIRRSRHSLPSSQPSTQWTFPTCRN